MYSLIAHPILLLVVILFGLAFPAVFQRQPLKRFARAVVVSALGVVLPLFIFVVSAALVPEWKGGCEHGWIDCFHKGKLALSPLVLWATGALYVVEVCRIGPPHNHATVLGLFIGALVAGGCFLYGVIFLGSRLSTMLLWLLVPLYVAVWHGVRAAQLMKNSGVGVVACAAATCGSTPFWIGGALWSQQVFASLPDNQPSCFVVTAASRGHGRIVGPIVEVIRAGATCHANRQLLTLWQFENLWRASAPQFHAAFRRAYNRVGPALARRITSPWLADIVFLVLKPAEILARIALSTANQETAYEPCQMD